MNKSDAGSIGSGLGNTKTRPNASKKWCFTLNNFTESEKKSLVDIFGSKGSYIFGEEVGESGTPHLQGYVEFNSKCRPMEFVKNPRIHWEKTKGSKEQNIDYCSKEGKIHTNMRVRGDPFKGKKPYEWQQFIIDMVATRCQEDRTIWWLWDDGNKGKTTLAKYICRKHKGHALYVQGKATDIKSAIASMEDPLDLDIVIFGIPRSNEEFVSYDAIESVKDGIFFSGKYESSMVDFDSPHVIILANFPPKLNTLTQDRWKVVRTSDLPLGGSQAPPYAIGVSLGEEESDLEFSD